MNRRSFIGTLAAAGTGAVAGGLSLVRRPAKAETVHFSNPPGLGGGGPFRSECDIHDCDVEGEIPLNIDGAFYRVGPDWQYPPMKGNIPFDGEGHVSMFRISNGHVDFKSRYPRTQRFEAQEKARRRLFGMYRNPFTDDPSVKGVSRGTANTHVVYHHGYLFSLKEDSPPVAMNPLTLETVDNYYTFGGGLHSLTHTAHPKFDHATGEMISYGYEAKGLDTDDVYVFSANAKGHITWEAWIKVPYVGMIHDFAVSQKYIAFLCIPMATNVARMKEGQVHFAWDSTLPTWFGVMERGGDGKDLRWFKGPERCATHVMGAFNRRQQDLRRYGHGVEESVPVLPQSPRRAVRSEIRRWHAPSPLGGSSRTRPRAITRWSSFTRRPALCPARTIAIRRFRIATASCPQPTPRNRSIRNLATWRSARPIPTRASTTPRAPRPNSGWAMTRACRNAASSRAARTLRKAMAILWASRTACSRAAAPI